MHATSVEAKDDSDGSTMVKINDGDQDDTSSSIKKREDFDDFQGVMLGKRRLPSRRARLPTESILLGKRRLPDESILLGKRRLPDEAVLLGRRAFPSEGILFGKRR
jgi:hypothetical protein